MKPSARLFKTQSIATADIESHSKRLKALLDASAKTNKPLTIREACAVIGSTTPLELFYITRYYSKGLQDYVCARNLTYSYDYPHSYSRWFNERYVYPVHCFDYSIERELVKYYIQFCGHSLDTAYERVWKSKEDPSILTLNGNRYPIVPQHVQKEVGDVFWKLHSQYKTQIESSSKKIHVLDWHSFSNDPEFFELMGVTQSDTLLESNSSPISQPS